MDILDSLSLILMIATDYFKKDPPLPLSWYKLKSHFNLIIECFGYLYWDYHSFTVEYHHMTCTNDWNKDQLLLRMTQMRVRLKA